MGFRFTVADVLMRPFGLQCRAITLVLIDTFVQRIRRRPSVNCASIDRTDRRWRRCVQPMPHVRRRYHPGEPKELDRGARPVSRAEPGDGCRRSQEAWRARLSLGDPGHQALPRGLRSGAENRDVRPGAVRSDDGAIPALGSQSVVVDVRIPAAMTYINRRCECFLVD